MKNTLIVCVGLTCVVTLIGCGIPPRPEIEHGHRVPINKSAPSPEILPGANAAKKREDKVKKEQAEKDAAAVKAPVPNAPSAASGSIVDIVPQDSTSTPGVSKE